MEATDVRVHQQSRALLPQHGGLGGTEYVAGSVNGSRAIRERLSAAVTTRQLKRAAAATTTTKTTTSLEYGHVASAESSSPIGNSGCLSGLLSIRGREGGELKVEPCIGSAIQEQPLDFSQKKKKRPGSSGSNRDEDDELKNKTLWKKSQGRPPTYLQVALESELNPRSSFVDDRRAASPFELSKPLLDHSPFLDGRGFGNSLLNDLMLSTSVQSSPKLTPVRPFKNYDSVHEYYSQKPPAFVSPSEMSPMDNGYSTDSYLDFRRQILNLQQSFAGSGCKRSGEEVVTEYLPQSSVQHGHEHLVHNHGHHHHHHQQRNGHHHHHHHHYGQRSSSDPLEMNQSKASSNSSCSSMSPVAGVHHTSPVGIDGGGAGAGGVGGSSLTTSVAVSSNRANRSTSSTSSAEGMAGTRRRAGRSLPDELKDEAYWERRRKNNEAAKRSRDARRAKEDEIAIRAAFLEQENLKLRVEVSSLKSETSKLRCLLYNS